MLLQPISEEHALHIDSFRQFGATLTRTELLNWPTAPLMVISLEDLVARTTAMVVGWELALCRFENHVMVKYFAGKIVWSSMM